MTSRINDTYTQEVAEWIAQRVGFALRQTTSQQQLGRTVHPRQVKRPRPPKRKVLALAGYQDAGPADTTHVLTRMKASALCGRLPGHPGVQTVGPQPTP